MLVHIGQNYKLYRMQILVYGFSLIHGNGKTEECRVTCALYADISEIHNTNHLNNLMLIDKE